MTSDPTNPYRSPAMNTLAPAASHGASIVRGLLYAIPMGMLGFAIPFALRLLLVSIVYWLSDSPFPLAFHLRDNLHAWIWPSRGCALVFALAAFLNYAPAARIDLLRAIALVALAMIGGILFSSIALSRETRQDDIWAWHRVLAAITIPIFYTLAHTALRLKFTAGLIANEAGSIVEQPRGEQRDPN